MYRSKTGKLERWFNPSWIQESVIPVTPLDLPAVRVRRRTMHLELLAHVLGLFLLVCAQLL